MDKSSGCAAYILGLKSLLMDSNLVSNAIALRDPAESRTGYGQFAPTARESHRLPVNLRLLAAKKIRSKFQMVMYERNQKNVRGADGSQRT